MREREKPISVRRMLARLYGEPIRAVGAIPPPQQPNPPVNTWPGLPYNPMPPGPIGGGSGGGTIGGGGRDYMEP